MITYTFDLSNVNWEEMKSTLKTDHFDNGRTVEQYKKSFSNSYLACIAYDEERIIGTVRVLSDGVCNAYIVDVWTLSAYRRQGIATQMMKYCLGALPGQHVCLFTDDAMDFYRSLGFEEQGVDMALVVGNWLKENK
jgi:ribosomal protein S18 acetylase RimI-like enzyme